MDKTPSILVTLPDTTTARYKLHGDRIGLGRGADNQIPIPSKSVSSCHCEFRKRADGGYEFVDLDSTNGSRVNGKDVTQHRLSHGDRILLGETIAIHFHILAAGEAPPTEAVAIAAPPAAATAAPPRSAVPAAAARAREPSGPIKVAAMRPPGEEVEPALVAPAPPPPPPAPAASSASRSPSRKLIVTNPAKPRLKPNIG